ncbi:sodium:solute symporter [Aneurinibacillus thermoaerophilus]|uniref:sodium:solute symporter n=1 Tax=Aneurinibacillus thermoaerophilus TaxID=143495 RepID=UPI002E1F99A9|nr:sodium:solute symporter [Aneurinibacillus thermoaerophilus]MED0738548.1 sodium:solute symporter [Aneurinibacillus thermoaerophilus]MED0764398.1 sodium:solute symporter [Aneurinibacillus thermoaerophilus]
MSVLDTTVVLLYFIILIVVGFVGAKKAKTAEDYALAGRNLGLFIYLGCLSAVILGGASTIGTAKLGYQFGLSGIWFVFMIGLGITVLGLVFIHHIYGANVTTISELLGRRYNKETRLLSALVAAIYTMMVSVTQVIGIGTIINAVLSWNMTASMLIGGGIVLFYTILGGMWSVTMTDIIQFIIMTVGIFLFMLPMSLSHVGGWEALTSRLPATYFDFTSMGWGEIFQYFLLYTLGMVVSQDIWQRVFTARTTKIARSGAVYAGLYSFIYALALSIIGMCALVALPSLKDTQNVFAKMALEILPPGILGLILASVCSALMSTASGTLLASSTLLSHDILKQYWPKDISDKKFVFLSRLITLVIGVIAIMFAIWIQDVLVALDVAYAILSGAIFVPVVLGFLWKKATAKAGLYSIVISSLVVFGSLAVEGLSSTNPIIYGIVTSIVSMVVLSYVSQPSSPSQEVNRFVEEEEGRKLING